MRAQLLAEKTWCQVEEYLKNNKTIIVPVGSTEQHSPSGIIGIDYLTSEFISHAVSKKMQILCAPVLPIGMAVHHMAFPGTMTLQPETYVLVIKEIIQSMVSHGFNNLFFVNGHGGNIAPITTAFCQSKNTNQDFQVKLINWWHLPKVNEYESVHFKDKNGFHATCGEVSVTMWTHPEAYAEIVHPKSYEPTPQKTSWPLSPMEFRKTFVDGRMGSDPLLANAKHGEKIFNLAVENIIEIISET